MIREATPADSQQIDALARKYEISLPSEGKIIVADDDNGTIKAFINIRLVPFIEPMISESPLAGKKLFDYIENKMREGGVKIMRTLIQPKDENLIGKIGFYKVYEEYELYEKNFYKN